MHRDLFWKTTQEQNVIGLTVVFCSTKERRPRSNAKLSSVPPGSSEGDPGTSKNVYFSLLHSFTPSFLHSFIPSLLPLFYLPPRQCHGGNAELCISRLQYSPAAGFQGSAGGYHVVYQ